MASFMLGLVPVETDLGFSISGIDVSPLLRESLRRFDVEDALRLIATVAAEQTAAGNGRRDRTLHGYQLALVVRYLLEGEPDREGRGESLSRRELAMCCDMAASVVSSPGSAFGVPVSDNAWSLAHRIAYQRFPDQEERGYVPRSLALYRQIAPGLQNSVGFRFDSAFEDAYGLSIDETWAIGYALYRLCLDNPGDLFGGSGLVKRLGLGHIPEAKIDAFLGAMACDYATFRSMLSVPSEGQSHFEPYNLNPLRKHPLLRLPNGMYIVPTPGFLLRRISHGLYYDLIELDRSGFISLIAKAFGAYVGRLVQAVPHGNAMESHEGSWIISDSDTALVIECITRPFGALSRATGDAAHVHQDLARRGGVVDSVQRLQRFLEERDARPDVVEALKGKRTIGLVVALEDFYLANGPLIRSTVCKELEARGQPPMDKKIQMAHVSGLEFLCALSAESNMPLAVLMKDKVDHASFSDLELDAYARHMATRLLPNDNVELTPNFLKETATMYFGETGPSQITHR